VTTDKVQELLAQPPNKVDFKELSAAVEDLDKKVALEDAELQERRALLDKQKEDLAALRGYRNFVAHFSPGRVPASNHQPAKPGGKREAILAYLADGKTHKTSEIRKALVAQGVMDQSEAQGHTLLVTLSRLFRQGELERTSLGVYKLASAEADDSEQIGEAVR
jgi:hypothetical protein